MTLVKTQMAGSTPGAVAYRWVVVALAEEVAAKTSSPEEIICQIGYGLRRRSLGGFEEAAERFFCTECGPELVGKITQGVMRRAVQSFNNVFMAGTAAISHIVRMGRSGNQQLVGTFFVLCVVASTVAVGAGKLMVGVEIHLMTTRALLQRCFLPGFAAAAGQ